MKFSHNYNRLVHEQSPYLLQHQNNPIWWYPWGDDAFKAAREEQKPVFISIGYSTCHWCHVMEGDSFEKEDIAAILNQHYIAIKVDREERPDVDRIYMDILVAMNGHGGWPISAILTPEAIPFFSGTFIPQAQLLTLLRQIHHTWETDRTQIEKVGQQVRQWLSQQSGFKHPHEDFPTHAMFQRFYQQSELNFDVTYGGFGQPPKFPQSMQLAMLLRIYRRTGSERALQMVTISLDSMARGGIYDHLSGGFHRYSTDRYWQIPHFEKMLYDNAQLAVLYLEALQVTKNPEYEMVARGIFEYVLRDMTHPQGGFYSAEDADSEKTEGKFYLWSYQELKQHLTAEEFQHLIQIYNVTAQGNYNPSQQITRLEEKAGLKSVHHTNAFYIQPEVNLPDLKDVLLQQTKSRLLQLRAKRIPPLKDNKILTAWNALMITAMTKGYQVLQDQRYLKAAQAAAHFLLQNLRTPQGALLRRWRENQSKYAAYLEDYAFFIQALLQLYQSDFNPLWFEKAIELQQLQDDLLWDEAQGAYCFNDPSDASILQRHYPVVDSSLPAGNAVSALNLLYLSAFTYEDTYKSRAYQILGSQGKAIQSAPTSYAQMLMALDYALDQSKEIAIIGSLNSESTQAMLQHLQQNFLPNKVMAVSDSEVSVETVSIPLLFNKHRIQQETTAYVCENNTCQQPTQDLDQFQELVNAYTKYEL
ncbi:thioredoxin domain-containing protein [Deltaproteobacteria bacterium TL4]